jgi:hypothetical protein
MNQNTRPSLVERLRAAELHSCYGSASCTMTHQGITTGPHTVTRLREVRKILGSQFTVAALLDICEPQIDPETDEGSHWSLMLYQICLIFATREITHLSPEEADAVRASQEKFSETETLAIFLMEQVTQSNV